MVEIITEINAQMFLLPPMIQYWMNWMLAIFMGSMFFIMRHKPARMVMLTFVVSMPVALLLFYFTENIHLFGIVHLVLWLPLLIFLFKKVLKAPDFKMQSLYGVWVILLSNTIFISLLFDIRDIALVLLGKK